MNKEMQENKVLCNICGKDVENMENKKHCEAYVLGECSRTTIEFNCKFYGKEKCPIYFLSEENKKLKEALRKIMNEHECKEHDVENSNEFICDDECFLLDVCAYGIANQALRLLTH